MVPMDQIISTLPMLDDTKLRELKIRINVLLGLGGGVVDDQTMGDSQDISEEVMLVKTISTVLHKINGTPVVLFSKGGPIRIALRKQMPELMKFFHTVDDRYRSSFVEMAVTLLIENIHKHQKIPLTPIVVVRQLSRIPAILDVAFPGYAGAGLLGMIIRAKRR